MLLTPHIDELVAAGPRRAYPRGHHGGRQSWPVHARPQGAGIKVLPWCPRWRSPSAWSRSGPTRSSARAWRPAATSASSPHGAHAPARRRVESRSSRPAASPTAAGGRGVRARRRGRPDRHALHVRQECTIHPDVKKGPQGQGPRHRGHRLLDRSPRARHQEQALPQIEELDRENKPEEIEGLGTGKLALHARRRHPWARSWRARPPRWSPDSARGPDPRRDRRRGRDVMAASAALHAGSGPRSGTFALVFPGQGSQRRHARRLPSTTSRPSPRRRRGALRRAPATAASGPRRTRRHTGPRSRCSTLPTGLGLRADRGGVDRRGRRALSRRACGARRRRRLLAEAGLELVVERASSWPTVPAAPGGCCGPRHATPRRRADVSGIDGVWVANDNALGQVVISGTHAGIAAATEALTEAGARRVVPLTVAGPFHCPLMEPARAAFEDVLLGAEFTDASIPVVQNTDPTPATDARDPRPPHRPDHVAGPLDQTMDCSDWRGHSRSSRPVRVRAQRPRPQHARPHRGRRRRGRRGRASRR